MISIIRIADKEYNITCIIRNRILYRLKIDFFLSIIFQILLITTKLPNKLRTIRDTNKAPPVVDWTKLLATSVTELKYKSVNNSKMKTHIEITAIFEFLLRETIVARDFNKYHSLFLLFEFLIILLRLLLPLQQHYQITKKLVKE